MGRTEPCRESIAEVDGREITGALKCSDKVIPAAVVVTPWSDSSTVIDLGVLGGIDTERVQKLDKAGGQDFIARHHEIATAGAGAHLRATRGLAGIGIGSGRSVDCVAPLPEFSHRHHRLASDAAGAALAPNSTPRRCAAADVASDG